MIFSCDVGSGFPLSRELSRELGYRDDSRLHMEEKVNHVALFCVRPAYELTA